MLHPRSLTARLRASVASFGQDEDGSATLWNVMWLSWFAIMGGLAIDSTNAWRHKTMMASTADVAALAGSMSLPNPDRGDPYIEGNYPDVEDKALEFAAKNMSSDLHGDYFLREEGDIRIGHWDKDTRTFTPGWAFASPTQHSVNAVQVVHRRDDDRNNNVQTTLLRFLGISDWEIRTTATAMKGIPECYLEGMMAEQKVCITSNNTFYPGMCIHGEEGLNFRNGNVWYPGTDVSSPNNASDNINQSNFDAGLDVMKQSLPVPMVDEIPQIASGIMTGNADYQHMALPGATVLADGSGNWKPVVLLSSSTIGSNFDSSEGLAPTVENGGGNGSPGGGPGAGDPGNPGGGGGGGNNGQSGPGPFGCEGGGSTGSLAGSYNGSIASGATFDETVQTTPDLAANRIYYYQGTGDDDDVLTINTAGSWLKDVVVISEAPIQIANDSKLQNVTLVSMWTGDEIGSDGEEMGGHSIKLVNDVQMGKNDDCSPGNGVRVFAQGSIHGSAKSSWFGGMIVSGGNVSFGAQQEGVRGVAVYAKGNVKYSANNTFGSADEVGEVNANGSCAGGVDTAFTEDSYMSALVD